jgi:hypothetical protein
MNSLIQEHNSKAVTWALPVSATRRQGDRGACDYEQFWSNLQLKFARELSSLL